MQANNPNPKNETQRKQKITHKQHKPFHTIPFVARLLSHSTHSIALSSAVPSIDQFFSCRPSTTHAVRRCAVIDRIVGSSLVHRSFNWSLVVLMHPPTQ